MTKIEAAELLTEEKRLAMHIAVSPNNDKNARDHAKKYVAALQLAINALYESA